MNIRSGLGIILLSALAASCAPSSNKSLEGRVKENSGIEAQASELTEDSVSRQDQLHRLRLVELYNRYRSANMVPVYVEDFNAFIESRVKEREAEIAKSFSNPDYWNNVIKNFGSVSSGYYPYRSRDITTPEKLEAVVS